MKSLFIAALSVLPLFLARPVAAKNVSKLDMPEDRLIVLRGEVNDDLADKLVNQLVDLEKADAKKPIYIVINSPGGSVAAGLRITSAMDATKPDIDCVVDEGAYSMAAIIFEHCTKRYIQKDSDLLFHQMSLQVEGPLANVSSEILHFQNENDQFEIEVSQKLKMSATEYRKHAHDEWWLTADEAVKSGAADEVVEALKYKFVAPPPPIGFFGFSLPQHTRPTLQGK
jgi:ATP-dependent Clp protease protease subunit